jgi:hypothetical protein
MYRNRFVDLAVDWVDVVVVVCLLVDSGDIFTLFTLVDLCRLSLVVEGGKERRCDVC